MSQKRLADHLKTAYRHVRRTPYQALAAVGVMVLTFFVTSVFVLLAGGSEAILRYFETRPQVTAFLQDDAGQEAIEELKFKLEKTTRVSSIKHISKDEALEIYQEQNKDDPLLLEMVTADILPASLEISINDLVYLNEVIGVLNGNEIVEEVVFQREVIEALKDWTGNIRKIGLILVGFMALISLLIVIVVIGMKVAARRQEIKILQLLGASAWFIRVPFLLEGILYGFLGAFIAWALASLLLFYSTPFFVDFLAGIPILPVPLWFMFGLLGGEVLLGALIGLIGSFIAVKRYLR